MVLNIPTLTPNIPTLTLNIIQGVCGDLVLCIPVSSHVYVRVQQSIPDVWFVSSVLVFSV